MYTRKYLYIHIHIASSLFGLAASVAYPRANPSTCNARTHPHPRTGDVGIRGEEDDLGLGGLHADAAVMVTEPPRQVLLMLPAPTSMLSLSARGSQTDREAETVRLTS